MPKIDATIVFEKNWAAINEMDFDESGNPVLDKNGKHQRKYKYIINRGSSRSSKTVSITDCYDFFARGNKDKRLTVWRDTKRICVDTVLNDAKKHFKRTGRWLVGQTFNKTDKTIHYTDTDSKIEFYGADDEETVHGLEQDVAWFNEPYKIGKDAFDQIDQRTSEFIFIDYNPKKGHWVEDLIKDKRAIVIDSTFLDNPFCPEEQKNKILSYKPVSMSIVVELNIMSTAEAMQYDLVKNELNLTEKQLNDLILCRENHSKNSADPFNWSVYGLGLKAERPNRIFRWNPITYEDFQQIDGVEIYTTDWGKVDPWAIVHLKYYDGNLYAHQLNYKSENEIRNNLTPTEIAQLGGEEDGIVTFMFDRLGIPKSKPIICDTNRPNKISQLRRRGFQSRGANKFKGSIIDGIDLLDNLTVYYTRESEDIAYEQENYSRKVDRHGEVLEEPEDVDNHCMDAIRYGGLYLQRIGVIKKT